MDGIFLSDFEQGEIGPDLFRHACLMGLVGMVSTARAVELDVGIVSARVQGDVRRV